MSTFDVVIVGGGLIGISTAIELANEKLRVAVFDRQPPGREASWAAAGMLSPAPESLRDAALVPLAMASLKHYPEFVAALESASGKSVGFARHGALEIFASKTGLGDRDKRLGRYRKFGIAAQAVSTGQTPASRATGFDWPAIWLKEEATVEPRSLFEAALAAAQRAGVQIESGRRVTMPLVEGDRCIGVLAENEKVTTGSVVIAAGCFSGEIFAGSSQLARCAPTRPVRGQMIAFGPANRGAHASLETVLRSDQGYLVPRRSGQIVAGSTSEEAGFEKLVTPEGVRKIKEAAVELMPSLAKAEVVDAWSGLRPGTPDDLPILGPTDVSRLLMATGHYRNGILLAPITAKLMRNWVLGESRQPVETAAFSPLRFGA